MGQIIIKRSSEWYNKYRKINLYIDNIKVDSIVDGELKTYEIEDGSHILKAKIDWCGSNKLTIDTNASEVHVNLKANHKISFLFQIVGILTFISILLAQSKENNLAGNDLKYVAFVIIPLFVIVLYHLFIGRNKYLILQEIKPLEK
ncbi:hypothetical protein [Plebeiibacterium sediminum]|uniref:Uncharacterized protein n=1 Tax=Plebeiibacterium sediminum TaxID=2992112 RepID=A0AAE3M5Y2_9BACT|nr:hypothetical protein [Plebeiobacterium sediminum]MCW3787449.1 hypothetical protein [Plebeiobacterium sediminum]